MSYKAEQIGRDRRMLARKAAARASRYAKRAEHRLSRRAAKADPENAPTPTTDPRLPRLTAPHPPSNLDGWNMARTPYPSKERNMTDAPTVNDTARSLLAFFGTMAEWGEQGTFGVHGASPELMALVCAVLDIVPAAWHPYPANLERDDGYVNLYQPTSDPIRAGIGSFNRCMAVHDVPRPPRYVERDPGQPVPVAVDQAVVAALVGLASMRPGRAGKLAEVERLGAIGRMTEEAARALLADSATERPRGHVSVMPGGHDIADMQGRSFGCDRVMATLTDEDIAKAEQDDLGGEGG